MVTLENSPNFPTENFSEVMGTGYFVAATTFGPEDLGWPCRRRRKYMSAIDLSTLIWVGPVSADDLVRDFGDFCFKTMATNADVFVNPDGTEEAQMRVNMGKNRGLKLSTEDARSIDVASLFTPRERTDFFKYKADAVEYLAGADACLCDLSQTHGSRGRMSCVLPTLLSSSKFYSFSLNRFLTHTDLEASLGFPRPGTAEYMKYKDDFGHGPLESLADHVRMSLNGNAMHLAAMAAWHAYVLSNLVKRDPVVLPLAISENGHGEDDLDATPTKRPKLRRGFCHLFSFSEVGLHRGRTFDYDEQ